MAYKHQVDQIVLISGDSDFVSAAKLARREGIDFVLDPLGAPISLIFLNILMDCVPATKHIQHILKNKAIYQKEKPLQCANTGAAL